jgi:EamA domain-containing membrane protein RarD
MLPLFGVLWGMLFLKERSTSSTAIALPIILLGLFICQGGLSIRRKIIPEKP